MKGLSEFKKMVVGAFAATIGFSAAYFLFLVIGISLVFVGLSMLKKARRKGQSLIPAYVVLVLGMALGLGVGAPMVLNEVSSNF